MKKISALALVMLLLAATAALAASPKTVLRMSLGDPDNAEMGVVANAVKDYVEKKTNGTVKVELFYAGGLGEDEGVQFRRVQTGKLDMALGGIANLEPMVKRLGVLTLPYLFSDISQVMAGIDGKAGELLNSYAQDAGLRILTWTISGFRYMSNSKHPITRLEDIRGLRFRVPQSVAMIETYRAFGAIPSTLAWNMTYKALEFDLVDGQCCDYASFKGMKFLDVGQKYLTEIHYTFQLQPLVISQRVFSRMSPELQKIMVDAGKYAQEASFRYHATMTEIAKQGLIAKGLQVSELTDEAKWKDIALQRVWPSVADDMGGKEAINAYLQACGQALWR